MERNQDLLARRGLTLSRRVLRRLEQAGIYAQSHVSLEHQSTAKRYVVRGAESGGAIKELGRYVSFCAPNGEALPYLHPIEAIGVNGLHSVVVAPALVRIEVFHAGRTWQLLITRHEPAAVKNGRRPALESSILFRGVNGFLDGQVACDAGDPDSSLPRFWSRAGEPLQLPPEFTGAVRAAARGASCVGCSHAHYLSNSSTVKAIGGSA